MASRIDSNYTASLVNLGETHQEKSPVCYCPACLGLQCLERPRYFAGQLLTEAELNSEQAYVIAKNKLHNRYLHGWGIVCGLQVVCHDCDGWVTVKQGYAIDPCGNDIIVCADQDFDVLKAIRECREGRRRRRRADCDPVKAPDDKSCDDIEEHWCVTIEYAEKEARPITPLRNEKKGNCGCGCGSSCGCGCGGNGNGKSKGKSCGCGCQGSQTSTQGAQTARTNAQCEPTRIYEQYRLNVVEEPEDCCNRHSRGDRPKYYSTDDVWSANPRLTGYMNALKLEKSQQAMILQVLSILPQDSLLAKIINCVLSLADFIRARLTRDDLLLLRRIIRDCDCRRKVNDNATGVFEDSEAMHRLCCNLQRLVSDLYSQNPLNVRCDYSCPPCPPMTTQPRDPNAVAGGPGTYTDQNPELASICCLAERLLQYLVDCICQALLPPCPPNPEDDRLILACLTIKNGKIINICNFSCRHYAGSFPSMFYWLSLVPVIPLLGKVIQCICCDTHLLQTLFDVFEPRSRGNQIVIDVEGNANEFTVESKRNQIGEIISRLLMHCFNFEDEAEYTHVREMDSPQPDASDLDELREQVKALRAEMETLKGKGSS
jgi:hypothetical protein